MSLGQEVSLNLQSYCPPHKPFERESDSCTLVSALSPFLQPQISEVQSRAHKGGDCGGSLNTDFASSQEVTLHSDPSLLALSLILAACGEGIHGPGTAVSFPDRKSKMAAD